jgi:hypothetical protein
LFRDCPTSGSMPSAFSRMRASRAARLRRSGRSTAVHRVSSSLRHRPVVSAFALDDLAAQSWVARCSGAMFMRMVALMIVGIVFSFPTFAGTELWAA